MVGKGNFVNSLVIPYIFPSTTKQGIGHIFINYHSTYQTPLSSDFQLNR